MEEDITQDLKEKLDEVNEHSRGWNRYLALTTAVIAVLAAIASLLSGNYANEALIKKNDAVLFQNKASDQWNFYQAKGIKKNLAQSVFEQSGNQKQADEATRYGKEQNQIQKDATGFEKKVEESNKESEAFLHRHHDLAISVTFFQIAIALSAIGALLRRKSFWYLSIGLSIIGIFFLILGIR